MKYIFPVLSLLIFLFSSCQVDKKTNISLHDADTLSLQYAKGFSIVYHPGFKEVIVHDPWKSGEVFARYYLVADTTTEVPANGVKIKVPLQNLAVSSATHFEFLQQINRLDKVNGVCSPELIYNTYIREKWGRGELENLGDAFNMNIEKVIHLQPEALMMSGYNQNDPYSNRVKQSGVKVVFNNEWMEKTLLGRAEWIRFVAVFFDQEKQADSVFNDIVERYENVKKAASAVENKPKILTGSNFRGTWYMPGGKSFMAQLFADAGGDYLYANDTTSGSLPLNIESVVNSFSQTDVWLNCNFATINHLVMADEKHALFQPVQNRRVYNFNARMLPSGANDFWESAVARPDLLLSDVIAILHPQLLPDYQMVYARKLAD